MTNCVYLHTNTVYKEYRTLQQLQEERRIPCTMSERVEPAVLSDASAKMEDSWREETRMK